MENNANHQKLNQFPPDPVSVKEALKCIPVSREAFYRKLKKGEIPCWKFGNKILVDVRECLEAMRPK
jgi:excisionase family DNA binding protein